MSRSGKRVQRARGRSAWESHDEVPALTVTEALPAAISALGDDVLAEIDMLLHEQDVLIGFWQAPGE